MRYQLIIGSIAAAVIAIMTGKAFMLDEGVKYNLIMFFFVGAGLALLRLFINSMMKKMKHKPFIIKLLFFGALLSVGLPCQQWFRTEVLFDMNASFIAPSITVMIAAVVMMTMVYNIVRKKVHFVRTKKAVTL